METRLKLLSTVAALKLSEGSLEKLYKAVKLAQQIGATH
jgi:hypothetical protein